MLYAWDIEVPVYTTPLTIVESPVTLAIGIITWVSVQFPSGCMGLVHCAIYHREHQIVPSKDDLSITGDTFPIEWVEYYEMYQRPANLMIRCWSYDDTYSHVVTIRMAVLPRRAVVPLSIADAIKGAFGTLLPKRISIPSWLGGEKE